MVTRRDYTAEGVEAARSVLVERVHLLGEYKDDIVLIGGCKFSSEKDVGPSSVAELEGIDDPEEKERMQRDAYERVNTLLKKLGIQV